MSQNAKGIKGYQNFQYGHGDVGGLYCLMFVAALRRKQQIGRNRTNVDRNFVRETNIANSLRTYGDRSCGAQVSCTYFCHCTFKGLKEDLGVALFQTVSESNATPIS